MCCCPTACLVQSRTIEFLMRSNPVPHLVRLVAAWRAATPLLVRGLLGLLGSPLEASRIKTWAMALVRCALSSCGDWSSRLSLGATLWYFWVKGIRVGLTASAGLSASRPGSVGRPARTIARRAPPTREWCHSAYSIFAVFFRDLISNHALLLGK